MWILRALCLWMVLAAPVFGDATTEFREKVLRLVDRTQRYLADPASLSARETERLRLGLEDLSEAPKALKQFLYYATGKGLLQLDPLRDDLEDIQGRLLNPATREVTDTLLRKVGFDAFARVLGEVSVEEMHDGRASVSIGLLDLAIKEVLESQDDFITRSEALERNLWMSHVSLFMAGAGFLIFETYDLLNISTMTPRELILSIGGVWAAAGGTYFLAMDYFKGLEYVRKFFLPKHYKRLKRAWAQLLELNPEVTAATAASAAIDKPRYSVTIADAMSDAAFDALIERDDEHSQKQILALFLKSLETGHTRRAERLLVALQRQNPKTLPTLSSGPIPVQLLEAVKEVKLAIVALEKKSFHRQVWYASLKGVALGLGLWGAGQGMTYFTPEYVARWRAAPTAVLGAIGTKRIWQFLWRPESVESLEARSLPEQARLIAALEKLVVLDPSGDIVSRIARFDLGLAAHQILTRLASEALAKETSGQVTMNLYRILREELSASRYSGERVRAISAAAMRLQRDCLGDLLRLSTELGKHLPENPPAAH